ncbi:uncharacterized protein LOC109801241 [Cajanus cajan]|uniref:uncharacterized protein LOC109801241 n=1 Tax=Cajanus cajan TaxID=3821 RepID=UPI00098D8622|nr:uncharacterized protein LOC109801241 [Cajanus cajan]
MNVPFPRFNLQSQMNALGLGFSSGVMSSEASDNGYRSGFSTSNSNNNNNSFLSAYSSIFGGSSSTCAPSTPVMASLLSSTLLQEKFMGGGVKGDQGGNSFQGLAQLEGLQMEGNSSKEVAEGQNRDGQCPEYSGEEQAICAVGLAKSKPGVFVEAMQYLLVLATPVETVAVKELCNKSMEHLVREIQKESVEVSKKYIHALSGRFDSD